MKKLIGKNIVGETVIVECENQREVFQAYRDYGKAGIALEGLDKAIKEEADRLVNRPDDKPKHRF